MRQGETACPLNPGHRWRSWHNPKVSAKCLDSDWLQLAHRLGARAIGPKMSTGKQLSFAQDRAILYLR